ncbi:MAG TPA: reverse transcriptase domain-containing protein, partial [Thermoguttaceae bacterium]|nr:reverse transcriptase domain-containing protein [Thermoguttaceae bacterium]
MLREPFPLAKPPGPQPTALPSPNHPPPIPFLRRIACLGHFRSPCRFGGNQESPGLQDTTRHKTRRLQRSRAYVVRYADDFVIGLTDDEDARRVMAVLPKRFGKYGLTIHPDKTRLVPFRKPRGERRGANGERPGTFRLPGIHALLG